MLRAILYEMSEYPPGSNRPESLQWKPDAEFMRVAAEIRALSTGLETAQPANIIPFRKVAGAEPDNTQTASR